jgi:hypothetical protein
VAPNDLWWHFGRFAEVVKGIDPATENFTPSMVEHPRLRIYQLTGKRTTLFWCRDTHNDWRSELERGEPAEMLTGLSVELPKLRGRVRVYDPWSGQWTGARLSRGQVHLPDFRRSLCVQCVIE